MNAPGSPTVTLGVLIVVVVVGAVLAFTRGADRQRDGEAGRTGDAGRSRAGGRNERGGRGPTPAAARRALGEFYLGRRGLTPARNGMALTGSVLSAAWLVGIVGTIAVAGFDGVVLAVGFAVGWMLGVVGLAELSRRLGRVTVADQLTVRLRPGPVRAATTLATWVVGLVLVVAQLVALGNLVTPLLGTSAGWVRIVVIVVGGLVVLGYTVGGGMSGNTRIQVTKTGLIGVTLVIMAVLMLAHVGMNPSRLITQAETRSGHGSGLLRTGLLAGHGAAGTWTVISAALALLLGVACLPQLVMRWSAADSGTAARRSTGWAAVLCGAATLLLVLLGFGAASLLNSGAGTPVGTSAGAQAAPLLAQALGGGDGTVGGVILVALFAATGVAAVFGVASALVLTAGASYARQRASARAGTGNGLSPRAELRTARSACVVFVVVAVVLAILARHLNGTGVVELVGVGLAVSASAFLPAMLLNVVWARFSTAGAVTAVVVGVLVSVVLAAFSPLVSGAPGALFPHVDVAWFPLLNPAIISVPAALVLGVVVSLASPRTPDSIERRNELAVRALTGAGAE